MSQTMSQGMDAELRECIQNCTDCHRICVETVTRCLRMGGPQAQADPIRLMLDCAQICQTSADFMSRGSDLHHLTCGVCAQVCERCATDCERLAGGDEQMTRCAEMCRRCAESCRRMAGSVSPRMAA